MKKRSNSESDAVRFVEEVAKIEINPDNKMQKWIDFALQMPQLIRKARRIRKKFKKRKNE